MTPTSEPEYPRQLISPDGEAVTIHLRLDFTSDEKVEVDDDVVVELEDGGRWERYHSSRAGTDETAFRNLEAPNRDGGMVRREMKDVSR